MGRDSAGSGEPLGPGIRSPPHTSRRPVVAVARPLKEKLMKKSLRAMLVALPLVLPAAVSAQAVTTATYITREQIQHVNRLPGTDRQIVSQSIGDLNLAVGIIHRGCTPTGT